MDKWWEPGIPQEVTEDQTSKTFLHKLQKLKFIKRNIQRDILNYKSTYHF
jgi:hypothetical protein